jgi:hypothetical protein
MTRAAGTVRFKDGEIKHFIVNRSIDLIWPRLFNTQEEAWAAEQRTYASGNLGTEFVETFYPRSGFEDEAESEPVDVFFDGDSWTAKATRDVMLGVLNITEILRPPGRGWDY